jgi:PPOX class probable F420-dependent enzyme
MTAMTREQRESFLREPRIAVLVSLNPDGAPTGIPVWFEWDGERARVFTSRTSAKIGRITADPRVCLTIAEPAGVPEAWVTIEGRADVRDEGGFALAQRLTPRYYRPEKAAKALAEWGRRPEHWVVIEIRPDRIRSVAPA